MSANNTALPDEDEYFSVKGAAGFMGVAVITLNRWRCEGEGPAFFKVGRRVLYAKRDLVAWLADRRFQSTSEYKHRKDG